MSQTPPWAHRIEKKIDNVQLRVAALEDGKVLVLCYFHSKHGDNAIDCEGVCDYTEYARKKKLLEQKSIGPLTLPKNESHGQPSSSSL